MTIEELIIIIISLITSLTVGFLLVKPYFSVPKYFRDRDLDLDVEGNVSMESSEKELEALDYDYRSGKVSSDDYQKEKESILKENG